MVKNLSANAGDTGPVPGLGRSPGEENGNPFLPGKFHGQRSLVGYSPRDCKELDVTQQLDNNLTDEKTWNQKSESPAKRLIASERQGWDSP